jgi:Flp pilus assembly protein TadG
MRRPDLRPISIDHLVGSSTECSEFYLLITRSQLVSVLPSDYPERLMVLSPLCRFVGSRSANVAITFGLAMVPTVFLMGMALDYSTAAHRQAQLNGASDAAALSAVTPAMMGQSITNATAQATAIFNGKAASLGGLAASPVPSVSITDSGLVRTATVSYTASATNNFPSILGQQTWPISGSSTASGTGAPNINFYLLLDASPSIAIAGSPAGITTMEANTTGQHDLNGDTGCSFACHESNPASDNLGNPGGEDNYTLARNLGVTLRIDLLAQAVSNLMTAAASLEAANNNTYQMAIYTFDYTFNTIYAPSGKPSSNLTAAAAAGAAIQALEVYDNTCLTSTNCNHDTDTD